LFWNEQDDEHFIDKTVLLQPFPFFRIWENVKSTALAKGENEELFSLDAVVEDFMSAQNAEKESIREKRLQKISRLEKDLRSQKSFEKLIASTKKSRQQVDIDNQSLTTPELTKKDFFEATEDEKGIPDQIYEDGLLERCISDVVAAVVPNDINSFLSSQELHPAIGSVGSSEFTQMAADMLDTYYVELHKLNFAYRKYFEDLHILSSNAIYLGAISEEFKNDMFSNLKKKFNFLKIFLRQNVCDGIAGLEKMTRQKNAKRRRKRLPQKKSNILESWFQNNLHYPFPSFEEKLILSTRCQLTTTQVNNWFGNRRIKHRKKCEE